MPGRHVRFSSESTVHSLPPPLSPSSTSSDSSLGPSTPPPAYAPVVPAPFTPKSLYLHPSAASAKGKGRAHPLITLSSTPLLRYDISLHPSLISSNYPGLSSAGFLEPAVYPPQPTSISLVTPHLPWTIIVPASTSNATYVTVADVLNAIYQTLRANATSAEYEALRTDKLMRRVAHSYTQRCERLRGQRGYAQEKNEGLKRVDFLMGYTHFQGIAPTSVQDVWKLTIS